MDFIVLQSSGIPLYIYSTEIKDDNKSVITSGYLSAIMSFAKESITGDIQSIDLGKRLISLLHGKTFGISYVLVSKKSKDEKNYDLKDLSLEFEKRYSSILKDWNGDVSIFTGFDDYINNKSDSFFKRLFNH